MKNSIKYKILPGKRLVIHLYEGKVTMDLIKENAKGLIEDEDFRPYYNEITDLRNSELIFNHKDDLINYVEFLKKKRGYLSNRKIAVLTDSPDHVVKSTLYKELGVILPMKLQVFSTCESALIYLDITDFSEEEFESIIDKLEENSVSLID